MKSRIELTNFLRSAVVPLVIGLAAGITGALTAESYLLPPQPIALAPFMRPISSVTAPLPESDIAARLAGANLPLYARRSLRAGDAADRLALPSEIVGRAAALTSDGWLVTHVSAVPAGGALVGLRGRLYEPTRSVVDARSGAVFLKIDAGALPVSGFEATENLRAGASLYALGPAGMSRTYYAGGFAPERRGRQDAILSSDKYALEYRLNVPASSGIAGGAVMTAGGNLAGIVAGESKGEAGRAGFVPMHVISPALSDIFRNQPIVRAALGLNYLKLDGGFSSGASLPATSGVYVVSAPARTAAAEAGFKPGDVIVRVDDISLSDRDLAELIAGYRPGDRVHLDILRNGSTQTLEALLR